MKAIKFMYVTFIFLLTIVLFSNSCKNNNPVDPDGNQGEIAWQQANAPSGGWVYTLAINGKGYIYAGTQYGVYYSSNNGDQWMEWGLSALQVHFIVVNASDNIFVATDEGIFRSNDDGGSWQELNTGLTEKVVNALVIHPNGSILAGTDAGLFQSNDNGENWIQIAFGDTFVTTIAINSKGSVFVGAGGGGSAGIYRTTDNGQNWYKVFALQVAITALSIGPNDEIVGGSFVNDFLNRTIFFRSTDNGESWFEGSSFVSGLNISGIGSLLIDRDGTIFAGTGAYGKVTEGADGIYLSEDNGESWVKNGLVFNVIPCLLQNSTGDIFAGTSSGIFRSPDNGKTWNHSSNGLTFPWEKVKINTIFGVPDGGIWAGSLIRGVFRSTDNSDNWEQVGLTNIFSVESFAVNQNGDIFVGSNSIFRSVDNGQTWTEIRLSSPHTKALVFHPLSGHIFAGTSNGILRSADNGDSWTMIRDLTNDGNFRNDEVSSLCISRKGDIFAGMQGYGVMRSSDNGDNWMPLNEGLTDSVVQVLFIDVAQNIWAGTSTGVFISTDFAENWIKTNLINTSVRAIAVNSRETVVVGTSNGVFISLDNGASWSEINNSLTNTDVTSIFVDNSGYILAGTRGDGVFKSLVSSIQ